MMCTIDKKHLTQVKFLNYFKVFLYNNKRYNYKVLKCVHYIVSKEVILFRHVIILCYIAKLNDVCVQTHIDTCYYFHLNLCNTRKSTFLTEVDSQIEGVTQLHWSLSFTPHLYLIYNILDHIP